MRKLTFLALMLMAVVASSCCGGTQSKTQTTTETMKYEKKYTNEDFYTDGVFNQDVAIEAMKDMLAFYDVPFTEFMDANFWVAEFGVGDFENVGMGGIFWVNDKEHNYFAHTIYLLPGQMIPEHAHMPTDMPAKFESWMVSKGWCYNFNEVHDASENIPSTPESHGAVKSKNFVVQNVGEIVHLAKSETFHFLLAGDEGAIVEEWASYHDNDGLRFTHPSASL